MTLIVTASARQATGDRRAGIGTRARTVLIIGPHKHGDRPVTTTRRFLPADPADFLRALVPLALLALAAAMPGFRLLVLAGLVGGTAVAIGRDAPVRWSWAAAVPVSVSLAWGTWPMPVVAPDGSDCAAIGSPVAVWRAAEAVVVLGVLAALAMLLHATTASLGLRMPARRWIRWAVIGFVISGPLALVAGPILARPFFGDVGYDVTVIGALVPALIFATGNGVMEEVIYRGALMGWSARVMGVGPALVGQAIVFGLAHSGPDVAGSPIPLMLALGVGGLLAGVIALRTRSLLIPIAVHIGLDVPIYYAFACAT
jgi:membrane protease YdiL (CAAX protease family)